MFAMPGLDLTDSEPYAARSSSDGDVAHDRWSRARTVSFIIMSSTLLWLCIGGVLALALR